MPTHKKKQHLNTSIPRKKLAMAYHKKELLAALLSGAFIAIVGYFIGAQNVFGTPYYIVLGIVVVLIAYLGMVWGKS